MRGIEFKTGLVIFMGAYVILMQILGRTIKMISEVLLIEKDGT